MLFVSATGDYYGAPRSMHLLIEGLIRRGFRIEVALASPGVLAERLLASSVPVHISPVDPYRSFRMSRGAGWLAPVVKIWRRLRWAGWLSFLVLARRPGIVYVNTLHGVTAALVARLTRTPVLWHLRGLETGTANPHYRRIRLDLVRWLAARVIAVSQAVAQYMRDLGFPADRLSVAYNGIDAETMDGSGGARANDLRATVGARDHDVLVSYVGRLDPHKGILDFLAAAGLLLEHHPELRFALIGGPVGPADNHDWPKIEATLDATPRLRTCIRFTGFDEHPYALMHASDVIVLPSHDEGFPRVVLEAMALGRAVVATAVGGIPEAIVDGEHGLLVPSKDPRACADAIARLADDEALRQRLGAAAAQRVRQEFTLDSTADSVARILHTVLDT